MKTKLLLLLLIGIFISVSASAAPLRHKPIDIEQENQMERSGKVKFRSFLSNSSLFINSSDVVTELSVAIINRVTNEVMYTETYSTFSGTCIDVSLFAAGVYGIHIILDSTVYLGNFFLYLFEM